MPDHEANYGREKRGCELLRDEVGGLKGFYLPSRAEKLKLIEVLGISKGFVATFDAIRLNVGSFNDIRSARDFDLLEMKVTDKYLPNRPISAEVSTRSITIVGVADSPCGQSIVREPVWRGLRTSSPNSAR